MAKAILRSWPPSRGTGQTANTQDDPPRETRLITEATDNPVAVDLGADNVIIPDDDPDNGDADSSLGSDTYTTSLTSGVFNYVYENGRRYHSYRSGAYPMPNDDREQNRLDMQHHICNMILKGELFRAPLRKDIHQALDIGTGTGIWAIDFADQFPKTEVVATDLSAIQPTWVPPNLRFEIDDCESDWPYSTKFDYIHLRSMAGSISDWPRLMRQAYNNLEPGGWIEVSDFETWASTDDDSLPETSSYYKFQTQLNRAAIKFGRPMNVAPQFKKFVENAGFKNVTEEIYKIPLSPWAKDPKIKTLSRFMQLQMCESAEPYSLALFTRVLGWDNTQVQVLCAGLRADLRNLAYHMYTQMHLVYGMKPMNE
ncbi:hypothetical protein FQN54_007621 [Arachnomyces sp. PD_36]|nr:hypothetical protein FQN54_007621 [Arachnomyces sp. PD_36]